MSKTLTLNLNKKLILEAVKADTYITGEIDKSADAVKNSALAYNEQAGDDQYHERKLTRTLAGAVGSLEAQFAEFVDTSVENGISDTLSSASATTGDFTITVIVSDRYNNGLAYPIAQLSQEYIVNKMLYYWWQSIRPALAKDYLAFSAESLTNIRLCLAKTAPSPSQADYESVSGSIAGGNGAASTTLSSTDYTAGTHLFDLAYSTDLKAALDAGNAVITCSNTSVSLGVYADSGTAPLFTILGTPYNLRQSDILALLQSNATNVKFKSVYTGTDPLTQNDVLIVTYRTTSA